MIDPIFARTRHVYDSYQDFWRLVELSGFETCFVDEMDLQRDALYVTTPINGEHRPHITHRRTLGPQKAKLVWWNLERHDSPGGYGGDPVAVNDDMLQYVDEIWCSDLHYQHLDKRMKFVPLGSHPDLAATHAPPYEMPLSFDFAMLAAPAHRRQRVRDELRRRGLVDAPNGWNVERSQTLWNTKLVLNVHQHENPAPIGEPLRFAVAAAHKRALVSETLADPFPLVKEHDVFEVPYDALVRCVLGFRDDAAHAGFDGAGVVWTMREARVSAGEHLYQTLCVDWPFWRGVEEACR